MAPARLLVAAVLALAALAPAAHADDQKAIDALNLPMKVVQDKSKSWKALGDAFVRMTPAPMKAGPDFNLTTVWPGMKDWDKVKAWAAGNEAMGKAIVASQGAVAFGLPYGRPSVPPGFVEKGMYIGLGDGLAVINADVAYLKAMDTVLAYVAAEMYRLGGEKKFQEAFDLGIASLKVMRQVADQQLLEEKRFAMERMSDLCSVHRDFMQTFLDQIPAPVLKKASLSSFPFIHAADAERLRRLDMPEGDRVLSELLLMQLFDSQGQPDPAKFALTMGEVQAKDEPLTRFGAAKRWEQIAEVHGSLDATRIRLTSVYDDWWRRWRVRYYDTLLDNPTAKSRTNKVRYAMVHLLARDMEKLFALRQRLNAELNGTALAAGLCAAYRDLGSWPRGIEAAYSVYVVKRFDYDPWDPNYGRWQYAKLDAPRAIETDYGRLQVSGALLYARGVDKEDGGAAKATFDGLSGDFVVWPALRALGRQQGAK